MPRFPRLALTLTSGLCLLMATACSGPSEHQDGPGHVAAAPAVPLPTQYAPMPEAASSFGAVASNEWLYLYGGHTVPTHTYSVNAVSGHFYRLNLGAVGATWEELPGGPRLQGMNLATYKGKIYRIGGMQPQNKPGDKSDNMSTADCASYDPAVGQWQPLPPLPETRSSHDVAVVGDKMIVIGGWGLGGEPKTQWRNTLLTMDLSSSKPEWKSVKQPFTRRALIVAAFQGKVWVMGGLVEDGPSVLSVNIYDPANDTWSKGPDLPDGEHNGFSPAACALGNNLYVSVADGSVFRLNPGANGWEKIGATAPRIVHRMVPFKNELIVLGGAGKGFNLASVDIVSTEVKATPLATAIPVSTASQAPAAQQVCPIMTDVPVGKDSEVVEYKGVKVLLCCDRCLAKWNADPEAYLQTKYLPQLEGVKTPARTLQQVYCPVFRDRVVSEKDPFVMYKGQKVYLFNASAVQKWNANPEKYADPLLLPQLAQAETK